MEDTIDRTCTSKVYKKDSKDDVCGETLLVIVSDDKKTYTYICPTCDALELMPKKMRERIKEQWEI